MEEAITHPRESHFGVDPFGLSQATLMQVVYRRVHGRIAPCLSKRIKGAYPDVKCYGLVEVPQADPGLVAKYVGAVMEHADGMAYEMEGLGVMLGSLARKGSC